MIYKKTANELKIMREGGMLLATIFNEVVPQIHPGMKTRQVDDLVVASMKKYGCTPSFYRVPHYHDAICISINEQVVHTPPSDRIINDGDIVALDIGSYYRGFHTDCARTFIVGDAIDPKHATFLQIGSETLDKAISQVLLGNHIGDISRAIYDSISSAGYCIIRELTGHGVGKKLHEDPSIPGYVSRAREKTPVIEEGMTLAVEVIYAKSSDKIVLEDDNWSLRTLDRSVSACFEDTVTATAKGPFILTRL
ncbi:MAG: Methionine aminopeptidase 1 [Microgenomates bacterium OLB22]|nr:MAG: Methionine aminopeptidase 1 [Microgenomates bacterium OLB22]